MRCALVLITLGLLMGLTALPRPLTAQDAPPSPDGLPFSWPFIEPPGPNTWLLEQHYGNTTQAFNFGEEWYQYGQGLHFGIDLEAPCGTPVHAIADGVVTYVDAEGFGAFPHSLVLIHPGTGYASLYGHLLRQPPFVRGDTVRRGQVIGLSGDPDLSCRSRPHLHLEIRSQDYLTAYNPLPFFDVPWHMLSSFVSMEAGFQQNLQAPRRWMTLETQPSISFSGNWLNHYLRFWPPRVEQRPPPVTLPARRLDSLDEGARVTLSLVSRDRWNVGAWWSRGDLNAVYVIDAAPGPSAAVFRQPLDGSPREYVRPAPPPYESPDGTIEIERLPDGTVRLTRRSDGTQWEVNTQGAVPTVSPGGTRLLWEVFYGEIEPGQPGPPVRVWVSDLDGGNPRLVYTMSGGSVQWLDDERLLIVRRIAYTAETQLHLLNVNDPPSEAQLLGSYQNLRDLQVAPGGAYLAFALLFQAEPARSGIYVQRTRAGSTPRQLPFFGAYRWRDERTLYTLSFDGTKDVHALGVADALTGAHRWLTDPAQLPLRVANGEWSVSPDGARILYLDPTDYDLYLLTIAPD